jgi:hypothetical protein
MNEIQNLTTKAEMLYQVRKEIEKIETEAAEKTAKLKEERDALQVLLISDMNKIGLKSVKVANGDLFTKASRKGVDITNEIEAMKWAIEKRAVNINKAMVASLLKEEKEMPTGFQLVETEYISVKKDKSLKD